MKTNNAIYNINRTKIKKTFKNKVKEYYCIFHCPININDCINSIDINNDKVVFGTLMGDVFLCRVDSKKLNRKNYENQKHTTNNENSKSSGSSLNKTENIENDESNMKLNHNANNIKSNCIKLSVDNNNHNFNENKDNNDLDDENDNVKIFNKKKKNINIPNIHLRINMNNNENNINRKKNDNENKNFTYEDNLDDEDENSNKYEKKLINKNMGKVQSTPNNGNEIKINININKSKMDSKIFNEKQEQSKNGENKTNNKNINFPQITKLIIKSKENIPCLQFENHDIINISIGDLEVIRLENMSTFNINDDTSTYNYSKLRNYKTENEHIEFCESCTCMMSHSFYLIVFTKFGNFNSNIEFKEVKYENKNLKKYEVVQGKINLSNYVVPFDFDGDKFLFLDYISKKERTINVFYTATKKEEYIYIIKDRSYGHISHMKLLTNNKIFLCRNNNECEIHLMNKDFDTIEKYTHFGDEVITSYAFIRNYIDDISNININYNQNGINKFDSDEKFNEENNESEEEKSQENVKMNILKLFENKAQNNTKKRLINIDQTVNVGAFQQKYEKKNNNYIKKNEKNLISSNGNEININVNYTESNHVNYNKKNLFLYNIQSLNPSFDNSSRRDINFTLENKRFTDIRNSKTNSATKYNLLTSDKKKKKKKNSISSIEIYGKKKQNGIKNKINKKILHNGRGTFDDNMDEQTFINNKHNDNIYIVTLDKNGSVNIFNNKKQRTLFNIYKIKNIEDKYKKLEFFSVGFPYYIVINDLYFCITTDHGLFVITKNND